MDPTRFTLPSGPRLLAAFGGLSLLAGLGLAVSRPAHSAGAPIAISVANTPLSTTAADDHDKQGVQFTRFIPVKGFPSGGSGLDFAYTVPAGKRLVIDFVSGASEVSNDEDHYTVVCNTEGGSGNAYAESFFSILPNGSPFPTGNMSPHQYADAGNQVTFQVYRTESPGSTFLTVTVTGHLIDMP